MLVNNHTSYLCGCFSIKSDLQKINRIDSCWEEIFCEEQQFETYQRFYYPEFVEFCHRPPSADLYGGVRKYRMTVEQDLTLILSNGREYVLRIKDVSLYFMPNGLLIYAIHLEQNGADLNDIVSALYILRNIGRYDPKHVGAPFFNLLYCIDKVYEACIDPKLPHSKRQPDSFVHLVENGNKFKLFQITELKEDNISCREHEELLFELGTLSPIGSYNVQSNQSASPEYFETIMKENKISVFNNWKGLSLLDTFTIIGYQLPPYLLKNWEKDYFEMIYLHSLFLKFYLFRMNILFRKNIRKISLLEREFIAFERSYCFHKISYNFLPLEIHKSLDNGLAINEEKELLYHIIEQEKSTREKQEDRKMNNLLFFLTCLTMFSAVWDSSCLFDQLYPYESVMGSTVIGYRFVAYSFFTLILVGILFNRLRRK